MSLCHRIRLGAIGLVLSFGVGHGVAHAQAGKDTTVLNPNLATEVEMLALPQIDQAAVSAIVAGRPYLRMSAFDAVVAGHVAAADREALYAGLFLPINLNDVTREEILLVPGVGDRMAREFEEYRPYRALAEFRREMGKYVDANEVARMERYVTIK